VLSLSDIVNVKVGIGRGVFEAPGATVIGGQQSFSQLIKKLFANGEQGFFYDPNDLSTMYQDAAGTVPVTAVGQAIGLIRDKSGRNNHARQTTSASRPILRKNAVTGANYLEFDGSDDFLQTSNIDFTATDKVSLFAGVRKLSDAATSILAELSTLTASNAGTFIVYAPPNTVESYGVASRGISMPPCYALVSNNLYKAPNSAVLSISLSTTQPLAKIALNGISQRIDTGNQGGGNYGNYPLYIGRRGGVSLPFNGHIYSLIGIGRLTTDSETVAIEKELAKRVGVTLNV
jgi:hypothetical protein